LLLHQIRQELICSIFFLILEHTGVSKFGIRQF
jgi:hypothetical protein